MPDSDCDYSLHYPDELPNSAGRGKVKTDDKKRRDLEAIQSGAGARPKRD